MVEYPSTIIPEYEFPLESSEIAASFHETGVIKIRSAVDSATIENMVSATRRIIAGEYATGLVPDKVKKQTAGSVNENLFHSACNVWKSNPVFLQGLKQAGIGELVAKLSGWTGCSLNQDTIFAVPPKGGPTAFHRDNDYQDWHNSPSGVVTVWMALSQVVCNSGGLVYALKSHNVNKKLGRTEIEFVGSQDPLEHLMLQWSEEKVRSMQFVTPTLEPGDVLIHHGLIIHGTGVNESTASRIAYSAHLMCEQARFTDDVNPVFSKFRLGTSTTMHEAFFPRISQTIK